LEAIVVVLVQKSENTTVGIRHADHVAPSIRKKLALTSLTSGGRSVGIVLACRLRPRSFFFVLVDVKDPTLSRQSAHRWL
jgi:hypothetical protein